MMESFSHSVYIQPRAIYNSAKILSPREQKIMNILREETGRVVESVTWRLATIFALDTTRWV